MKPKIRSKESRLFRNIFIYVSMKVQESLNSLGVILMIKILKFVVHCEIVQNVKIDNKNIQISSQLQNSLEVKIVLNISTYLKYLKVF